MSSSNSSGSSIRGALGIRSNSPNSLIGNAVRVGSE